VRWDHEVVAAVEDSKGVEVRVRGSQDEHPLRAGWLVGCDGAHSAVRALMALSSRDGLFQKR
jgi:2-polyprenyl-6-methoxyphenol hydroxylase-like FAD-dependent oxidoreductase